MTRIVLDNASIFDGDGGRFTGACVIEGGRITAVGEGGGVERTPDDLVYDLSGQTLMPGLISCHMHADMLKFTIAEFMAGDRIGKERPPGYLMACAVRTSRILIESGFTGYVGAAGPHNIDSQLKMAIEENVVPGPRIRPCSHHIGTTADNNDPRKWWHDFKTPGTDLFADGPDALRRLVREEIRCGAEMIKFYASGGQGIPDHRGMRNMSREEMKTIVDTAHERGVPVRAHVAERDLILECIELGVDVIDHGNGVDEECIARMAEKGTFWVPSLLFTRVALDSWAPGPGPVADTMANMKIMLPKADVAGVRILLGDDYGVDGMHHGHGVHARELGVYVREIGLDPARVLRWGTRNGGELLAGKAGEVGVLKPGAVADLIVLSADPFADVTIFERPDQHVVDVMRDGRFHFGRLASRQTHQGLRAI